MQSLVLHRVELYLVWALFLALTETSPCYIGQRSLVFIVQPHLTQARGSPAFFSSLLLQPPSPKHMLGLWGERVTVTRAVKIRGHAQAAIPSQVWPLTSLGHLNRLVLRKCRDQIFIQGGIKRPSDPHRVQGPDMRFKERA